MANADINLEKKKPEENQNLLFFENKLHYMIGTKVMGSRNTYYVEK